MDRRILVGGLIVALAAAGVPVSAEGVHDAAAADASALRVSIDRAVDAAADRAGAEDLASASLTVEERTDLARRAAENTADPVAGQSPGGMSKGKVILTILGLAVSAGTTWYYIKFMREQQEREEGRD